MRETFIKYIEEADKLGISESRAPERFAILMLGAEILSNLMKGYGLEFNLEEAKRALAEHFKTEDVMSIPEKLINVVYAISKSNSEDGVYIEFDDEKDAYVVGMKELKEMQNKYNKMGEFPSGLKELATLIINTFPEIEDVKNIYGPKRDSSGKVRKVCFVPANVYEYVLGYVKLETESYNKDEIKAKVIKELENAPRTFDELLSIINVPERVLTEAILELESEGVIWSANGYYRLRRKPVEEVKEEPKEEEKEEEKIEETEKEEKKEEEGGGTEGKREEELGIDELIEKLFGDAEVLDKEFRWDAE